ncbi:hypothetical protein NA57DRAFT_55158 [Rhizodiscina lignyota]|uniref:Uncharacterized protein n=1 Tax=Rhizodiscina lignyota TaxID=1504668 RepID=A0A9P4M7W0_9PEZI|nr:hypothetical protein NA57DRAFT_55158 [Rhizodiscina lignyota]
MRRGGIVRLADCTRSTLSVQRVPGVRGPASREALSARILVQRLSPSCANGGRQVRMSEGETKSNFARARPTPEHYGMRACTPSVPVAQRKTHATSRSPGHTAEKLDPRAGSQACAGVGVGGVSASNATFISTSASQPTRRRHGCFRLRVESSAAWIANPYSPTCLLTTSAFLYAALLLEHMDPPSWPHPGTGVVITGRGRARSITALLAVVSKPHMDAQSHWRVWRAATLSARSSIPSRLNITVAVARAEAKPACRNGAAVRLR